MKSFGDYMNEIWGEKNSCLEILLNEKIKHIAIKSSFSLFIGLIFLIGFFMGHEDGDSKKRAI